MDFIPVYQDVLVGMRPLDSKALWANRKELRLIVLTSVRGSHTFNPRSADGLQMTGLTR